MAIFEIDREDIIYRQIERVGAYHDCRGHLRSVEGRMDAGPIDYFSPVAKKWPRILGADARFANRNIPMGAKVERISPLLSCLERIVL